MNGPPVPRRVHLDVPLSALLLLAGLTLVWGGGWPANKIALSEIPIWTFRAAIPIWGSAILFVLARLSGQSLAVPSGRWMPLIATALLNVTGWHLGTAFGLLLMDSGRTAVIGFTMPLWASLFGIVLLGEPFTRRLAAALALGTAGLALLMQDSFGALSTGPAGAAWILSAAASWGLGTVFMKRIAWNMPTLSLTAWQLLFGSLPFTAAALAFDSFDPMGLSSPVLGAVAFLLFAMPFCHYTWFRIVRLLPANVAAISTLMIPVAGVLSGSLVLGEAVGWREIGALVAVCGAIGLVLVRPKVPAA